MNYQCTRITADGRAVCQRTCEADPWQKVADALGLELPTWCHPATAIVLDIARLHDIERLWADACAIARVHCPVSVGRSHIRDGIPALATRAARIQAERDEAVRLLHMLDVVRGILERTGCDCECGCDADGHSDDCEPCLACQIGAAIQ